ncbi:hypothetical protein TIFTF001_002841 [Ficus carica]|uniref:RRM domain-containing protein n=1 Tax=Ficus carica TaxID=3494 RepID=A0AA87ZF34_FICCA|nr:hypothetical protein TIFTF001_002841 [Ficus carica]
MGKKKPKEPETNTQSDAVSSQPDVFSILFGDVNDKIAAVSIFSDDNPFRRKPQEHQTLESSRIPDNGGGGENHPDVAEQQSRKRKSEKKTNLGLDSAETESEIRKKKKGKQSSDLEEAMEVNGNVVEKENKKKRKRDEVEKEYEARKYGAVEDNAEGEEKRLSGKVGEKRKSVDNPAETMVPKEGFDEESKLLRTVFVGNLPLTLKKKPLIKEFSKFGEVESVRIRSVPLTDTKTPRKGAVIRKQYHETADSVHAYVVFKTEESAQASLSHNMAVVGDHHIRVDRACPPRKKMKGDEVSLYDHKRTVFVGNLPFDVKDEEVYQLFCGINNLESSVEGVRIIRDPHNNLGKGFAYVLFKTREAANLVVKKRNLKLRDRELRLFHAKPDSTPSKRRNSPSAEKTGLPPKNLRDSGSTGGNKNSFTNISTSYQGMRASKSGVQKKVAKGARPEKSNTKTQKAVQERKQKRPAVAARKAKVNTLKEIGASKQAGTKRKMDSRTPESSHRKKAKKLR